MSFSILFGIYGCSLISNDNNNSKSAYEIAVENGFEGTEEEWIISLINSNSSKSAYQLAVENGFEGTEEEWLISLITSHTNGLSAYQIAVKYGFEGTEEEWLLSLVGSSGQDGQNGAPGKDGQDLTVDSLFDWAVQKGLYTDDEQGYALFLQDYLQNVIPDFSSIQQVATKAVNQVVSIYCPTPEYDDASMGAGVFFDIDFINREAYIVTNYHVVTQSLGYNSYGIASDIFCYLYGNETYSYSTQDGFNAGSGAISASFVGGSINYDLAVLKISGEQFDKVQNSSASAVEFASTTDLQVGSGAIAVGNPMGQGISVTSGIVSKDSEYVSVEINNQDVILRCLRMDTSVNGGNSGGGLFNLQGQLIGIVNAKFNSSLYENIANAIPATNVYNVVQNILYFSNLKNSQSEEFVSTGVYKITLGFTRKDDNQSQLSSNYDELTFKNNKSSVICVQSVVEDSIASQIGLQVDDVILGLTVQKDEQKEIIYFDMFYDLQDYLLSLRPEDKISLIIKRGESNLETNQYQLTINDFVEVV